MELPENDDDSTRGNRDNLQAHQQTKSTYLFSFALMKMSYIKVKLEVQLASFLKFFGKSSQNERGRKDEKIKYFGFSDNYIFDFAKLDFFIFATKQ
jgi:hypothetical protein